ncbi:MAG: cytochrome c-type biogenesis protein CcmH [bacterium]
MRSKKIIILLLLSFLLCGFILAASTLALTVDDVARDLICVCGCGKTLGVCEMEECAQPMKELIAEKIAQGETKDQIIGYFVVQYGEKVLAAPTKKGFNLTAWITPFVAIGIGAGIVYLVLTKWVFRGKIRQQGTRKTHPPEMEDKYSEKLKKELEEFDF